MIAVDTSALMAVVLDESDAAACRGALETEAHVVMSAGTLLEALIVASGRNVADEVEQLVAGLGVEIMPVTAASARRAAEAYVRWGKGFDRAGLNYGDCFAYEIAADNACPLLFIGNDFIKTDIASAI